MKTYNTNRGYNRFSKKCKKSKFSKNNRKNYNKKTQKLKEGGKWGIPIPPILSRIPNKDSLTSIAQTGRKNISSIASQIPTKQSLSILTKHLPLQTNAAQRYKYPVLDIFWQLHKISKGIRNNDITYQTKHKTELIYLIQSDIKKNYALILLLYNLGESFDKRQPSDAEESTYSETEDSSNNGSEYAEPEVHMTEVYSNNGTYFEGAEETSDVENEHTTLARYILLFEKFRREQKIKFENDMYTPDNTKVIFEDAETLIMLLILFKNIMDENHLLIEQAKQLQDTSSPDGKEQIIPMNIENIKEYAILCTRHLPSCNNAVETLGAVMGRKALEPFLTSNGIIRGLELAIGTPGVGCSEREYGNPYRDTELKAALNWNQSISKTVDGNSSNESFFKLIKSKPGRLLVYVSNLIRTWMTASILYGCSDIGISYELVLIVAPHLKEHHLTKFTKELRRGNYPIDIETQMNYFKQFLQIVYNFCNQNGIKMVKTIHIKFPMFNTQQSGEDPRDFITFTIKLGTSINSSSTNFVSSYDYYGLSEELTGTTPTVSEPFTSFYSKKNYTQNGNLMHFFNWLNIHHAYIIGELNKHANETNQISQNQMILMVAHSNIMQAFAKYLNTPPNRATYETNAWSIFIKQNMLSDVIVNRKHHFIPILGVPKSCSTDLGWAKDKICNPIRGNRNSLESGSIVWKHTSTQKYQTNPLYLPVGGKSRKTARKNM